MTEYLAGGPVTRCYDQHRLGLSRRLEGLIAMSSAVEFARDRHRGDAARFVIRVVPDELLARAG